MIKINEKMIKRQKREIMVYLSIMSIGSIIEFLIIHYFLFSLLYVILCHLSICGITIFGAFRIFKFLKSDFLISSTER